MRGICANKAAIFELDAILPVDLYLDASNLATNCYISQIQNGKVRVFVYNSFTLLLDEQNNNTYRRELVAIVQFTKKIFSYAQG